MNSNQIWGLIFSFYILTGCNNSSQENSLNTSDTTKVLLYPKKDSLVTDLPASSPKDYNFEPIVSSIRGTLKVEMYYGPPNYGESPETDTKENAYVLYLDQEINVIQTSKGNSYNVSTKGVSKIQLAQIEDISLQQFVNKRIKVTRQFYGKHTGHHHTDILMMVSKAEKE